MARQNPMLCLSLLAFGLCGRLRAPHLLSNIGSGSLCVGLSLALACNDSSSEITLPTASQGPVSLTLSPEKQKTRYIRVRTVLEQNQDSPERAARLHDLVSPLCANDAEQDKFFGNCKVVCASG